MTAKGRKKLGNFATEDV